MNVKQAKELVVGILDDEDYCKKFQKAFDLQVKIDGHTATLTSPDSSERAKRVAKGKRDDLEEQLELYINVVANTFLEAYKAVEAKAEKPKVKKEPKK